MPDYQKGKIYRILQDNDKTVYIGSTTQPLSARMSGHRRRIKQKPHFKLYKLMAEVGVERFTIELVADFPCERREQLCAEEGRHIRLNNTVGAGANNNVAGRTLETYREDNAAALAASTKTYRDANKEAITASNKSYRESNKEAIAARMKAYIQDNREAINASHRLAYQRKKAAQLVAAVATN